MDDLEHSREATQPSNRWHPKRWPFCGKTHPQMKMRNIQTQIAWSLKKQHPKRNNTAGSCIVPGSSSRRYHGDKLIPPLIGILVSWGIKPPTELGWWVYPLWKIRASWSTHLRTYGLLEVDWAHGNPIYTSWLSPRNKGFFDKAVWGEGFNHLLFIFFLVFCARGPQCFFFLRGVWVRFPWQWLGPGL